jgi:hypothetical protein
MLLSLRKFFTAAFLAASLISVPVLSGNPPYGNCNRCGKGTGGPRVRRAPSARIYARKANAGGNRERHIATHTSDPKVIRMAPRTGR